MRFGLTKVSVLTMAVALASGSMALAQDNTVNPASTSKTPQVTQPSEGGVNWKGVGVGAGTMAGNVLYVPAKLAYGLLGGIGGGAAWALTGGNTQVANTVWRSSLGGDYILTPDMIEGKQKVHFTGPTNTAPAGDETSSAATTTSSASLASASPTTSSSYPATSTSSSLNSSSTSSSSMAPSSSSAYSGGSHPLDSGAGPMSGSATTSSYKAPSTVSSSSYSSSASTATAAPKLNTSIE